MGNKYCSCGKIECGRIPQTEIADAKLLQQKMVDDGWDIRIHNWPNRGFEICARNKSLTDKNGLPTLHLYIDRYFLTKQQAIVELFCKVYGIKEVL